MRNTIQRNQFVSALRRGILGLTLLRECGAVVLVMAAMAGGLLLVPEFRSATTHRASGQSLQPIHALTLAANGDELWMIHRGFGLSHRTFGEERDELVFKNRHNLSDAVVFTNAEETVWAIADYDGSLEVWCNGRLERVDQLKSGARYLQSVAIGHDGRTVLSIADDGDLFVVRRNGSQTAARVIETRAHAGRLRISPDGKLVAWADGRLAFVWDWERAAPCARWTMPHESCTDVAWSPCGQILATVGTAGQLCVWDIETQRLLWNVRADIWDAHGVTFTHDGQRIITGGFDHLVRVWDAQSGESIAEFSGHRQPVRALVCSPDSGTVYSADLGGCVLKFALPPPVSNGERRAPVPTLAGNSLRPQ